MATVVLSRGQKELLKTLSLPTEIDTDMDDDLWCDILDRLLTEVQLRGINKAGDGENSYGMFCSSIYNAMVDAEEEQEGE